MFPQNIANKYYNIRQQANISGGIQEKAREENKKKSMRNFILIWGGTKRFFKHRNFH